MTSRAHTTTQSSRSRLRCWPAFAAVLMGLAASCAANDESAPPLVGAQAIGGRELSQGALTRQLVMDALDSEALYTLWGGLKPMSSGFWRATLQSASLDLADVERVRAALGALRDDTFYADVQLFDAEHDDKKFTEAYVVHRPAFAAAIERAAAMFARHGIAPSTHPAEVLAVVDRLPRADRWRAYGLLFGYPEYAVDFFVEQGIAADERAAARKAAAPAASDDAPREIAAEGVGRGKDRGFLHVPTFASPTGCFAWAVPLGHQERDEDRRIARDAGMILAAYREARAAITDAADPVAAAHTHWRRSVAMAKAAIPPPRPAAPAAVARGLWGQLATGPNAEHRLWCLAAGDQQRWTHLYLDLDRDGRFDPATESFPGEVESESGRVRFRPPGSALGDDHTLHDVSIDVAGTISIGMRWRNRAEMNGCWREGPVTSPQFSATPAGAPLIHFDLSEPLDIMRYEVWPSAIAGRRFDVRTVIGRRGQGESSFAAVSLDDVLPAGFGLEAELRYHDRSGSPRHDTFPVMQRSSGRILFGWITIPADAAPGTATIRLHGNRESVASGPGFREQSFAIEIRDSGQPTPDSDVDTATRQDAKPASSAVPASAEPPLTLDFENSPVGEAPSGWRLAKTGWRAVVDDARAAPAAGNRGGAATLRSARLELPRQPWEGFESKRGPFGNLMRFVAAEPYRGKVVRVRASMFVDPAGVRGGSGGPSLAGDDACLWFRVDRPEAALAPGGGGKGGDGGREGCFGRTDHQPLIPGTWQTRELIGAVAPDAQSIVFGMVLAIPGPAWLDEVTFEVIGDFRGDPPGTWPEALARVPLDKARDPNLHLVQMASSHLSTFSGREITMRAGVVTPPDAEASSDLPICYIVHGFGGDHLAAWSDGAAALGAMRTDPSAPRMVYVYLDANCPFGHHEFAQHRPAAAQRRRRRVRAALRFGPAAQSPLPQPLARRCVRLPVRRRPRQL